MGRAVVHKPRSAAATAPREPVSARVYDGIDFDALNADVSEIREMAKNEGADATFSKVTGVPTVIVHSDAPSL